MAEAAVEAKKTRGDGPVQVTFADAEKADHKRVPEGVVAVIINGKRYDVSAIPAAAQAQLVAFAFASRAKMYVNNHAEDNPTKEVVADLVDKVHADLAAGRLYGATSEGKAKSTKEYDPSDWVSAVEKARQIMNQRDNTKPLATPAQLEALRAKIMGLEGKDRTAFIMKLKSDKLIGPAYMAIQAAKRVKAYKADAAEVGVMEEIF